MVKDSTSRRQRKDWAARTAAKLHGHRRQRYPNAAPPQRTGIQSYTSDLPPADVDDLAERRALAQPSRRATAQERRDQYVEAMIYPWAYGVCLLARGIRDSRTFNDHVELLTAHAECGPHYEDEKQRLLEEDQIELPEDPREHYQAALSEWGRSRHLRKICRLTGTYPMDTGDMTTGEVYAWYLELHDAVAKWRQNQC